MREAGVSLGDGWITLRPDSSRRPASGVKDPGVPRPGLCAVCTSHRSKSTSLDDPNAMVDDTRRIDLVLQGFRKAEQHIAAIHLAAGERGCPAGDAGSIARAI